MLRRGILFTILAAFCTISVLVVLNRQWRSGSQSFDRIAGDESRLPVSGGSGGVDPNAWRHGKEAGPFREPKVENASPFSIGQTRPAGSNYTRTLVVPKLKNEDTSWIQEELGDMLDTGLLNTAIYTMDDPNAPLRPVKNKGHEVMAYLSYIIDFYDDLPDVAVFMHAHRYAWHNNLLLDKDSSLMIRHLSPERVTREGYMNLRCHWDPGCPDWLHPGTEDLREDRHEQKVLADCWAELFPNEPMPTVLAQPCCAQFALSRERIQSMPKERFTTLRDWVLRTELDDFLSGRIFEYTWQYIFTSSPLHCPSMSACYCDGYGVCFGDAEKFDYYFELDHYVQRYTEELEEWKSKTLDVAVAHERAKDGKLTGQEMLDVPQVGRDDWLKDEIVRIEEDIERLKIQAIERGKDPRQRAVEAGREWSEGDGF